MNKLTEIKERLNSVKITSGFKRLIARESFENQTQSDIEYLLSLLEEKDKALAFYADEENYSLKHHLEVEWDESDTGYIDTSTVQLDRGTVARKALNTSSKEESQ